MNYQQPTVEDMDTDVLLELILRGGFTWTEICCPQDFSSDRRKESWRSNNWNTF